MFVVRRYVVVTYYEYSTGLLLVQSPKGESVVDGL